MSVRLLLLLLLNITADGQAVGKKVMTVFPEIIAHYHPTASSSRVHVVILHDDTVYKLNASHTVFSPPTHTMNSGNIGLFTMDPALELDQANVTDRVLTIVSDKDIGLQILSRRGDSIQTATLLPMDQLGREYRVPPIPQTEGPYIYGPYGSSAVTERSPFRLIVASVEEQTVYLPRGGSVHLGANQVAQVWVYGDMVNKAVTGPKPFLALFAHPCLPQSNCTCGMIFTPLVPYNATTVTYILPLVLDAQAANHTYLLKPSKDTPAPHVTGRFEENGPVVLHMPGLLMNLIPLQDFGSCFVVYKVVEGKSWAVIVAPAGSTRDVQMGSSTVEGTWDNIHGTEDQYKSTKVELRPNKTVFWTKGGLMAVYLLGKRHQDKDIWFGSPALRISKDPDHRGCVVVPEEKVVLEGERTWQESIQACKDRGLNLISLSDPILQTQIYNWIPSLNQNLTELWMGLRRSSFSRLWYWISEDPVSNTDWSQGSAEGQDQDQCGRISLKTPENPGWSRHHCCHKARALCYKPPVLLRLD